MTERNTIIGAIKGRIEDLETKGWSSSKLETQFIQIVIEAIDSFEGEVTDDQIEEIKTFFSPRLCPDQYVGTVGELRSVYFDKTKRTPVFKGQSSIVYEDNIPKDKDANIMILILESPHKDEFDKDGKPLGPAMGATGRNIVKHIGTIFENIGNFQNYHLILMNPIPFQCSLGVESSGFIRDAVFAAAWKNGKIGKCFFKGRLDALLGALEKKTVVIVNACTQGGDKKDYLCCKVCKSVMEILSNYCDELPDGTKRPVDYYHIHHPSSWKESNSGSSKKPKSNTLEIDKKATTNKPLNFPEERNCDKYQECDDCTVCDGCTKCKKFKTRKACYGKITYQL